MKRNFLFFLLSSLLLWSACQDKAQDQKMETADETVAEHSETDAKPVPPVNQLPPKSNEAPATRAAGELAMVEIITPLGNMKAVLYDATPQHRDNFLKLASEDFYDGTLFHRVIQGFMIQGGDPQSKGAPMNKPLGAGGPGYTIPAEFVDTLHHRKGALSAARQGDAVNPQKASSGSQFYIVQGQQMNDAQLDQVANKMNITFSDDQRNTYKTLGGTPFLDQNYTVFGQVIEGLEVIDKIAAQQISKGDRPTQDIPMQVRVLRK